MTAPRPTLKTPARKKPTSLSMPMLNQLMSYVEWAEMEGSYYGNKEHFRKRHAKIKAWLEAVSERRTK